MGEPGVKFRAIYDYEPQESDELELKQGDLFEKLCDQNDNWCKGRKDDKVGLYPHAYAIEEGNLNIPSEIRDTQTVLHRAMLTGFLT